MGVQAANVLAALCAAVTGLAIQRGATCTVAPVDELLAEGRPARLLAMLEASLWVGGGVLLIPGSNDGLVLPGMPLSRLYAWAAFATTFAVVAAALGASRWWAARPAV
jgi:toxin CptA